MISTVLFAAENRHVDIPDLLEDNSGIGGKAPHSIVPNRPVGNVWQESEEGIADVYRQLAHGLQQQIDQFPAMLDVSVGWDGLVDIGSSGSRAVKAMLLEERGEGDWQILAESDDSENDRNFLFSKVLKKGLYRLRLEAVGQSQGNLIVWMSQREEEKLPTHIVPFRVAIELGSKAARIGFVTAQKGVVQFGVSGQGSYGISLQRGDSVMAEGQNRLFAALEKDREYALLFWSVDDSAGQAVLNAETVPARLLELDIGYGGETKVNYRQPTAIRVRTPGAYSYTVSGQRTMFHCSRESDVQCLPIGRFPLGFENGSGWIVVEPGESTDNRIQIEPFELELNEEVSLTLDRNPLSYTFAHEEDGLALLSVASSGAEIGTVVREGVELPDGVDWHAMFRRPSVTVTAVLGRGDFTGRLWLADSDLKRAAVRLHLRSMQMDGDIGIAQTESLEEEMAPATAKRFDLPNEKAELELILGTGMCAGYFKNGKTVRFLAAVNDNLSTSMVVEGGTLIFANSGRNSAAFRLRKKKGRNMPQQEPISALNRLYENYFRKAGTLHLAVEDIPEEESLFVDGRGIVPRLLHGNGQITTGKRIDSADFSGPGILELEHPPGYVQVWLGEREDPDRGRLGENAVQNGAMVLAEGIGELDNAIELWEVVLERPALVVVAADAVGITFLQKQDRILAAKAGNSEEERLLAHYLPKGRYTILTRPIRGMPQQGTITIETIQPVDLSVSSGSQPKRFIQPNEYQAFAFVVAQDYADVEVGIEVDGNAESNGDTLEVKLYSEDFSFLGEGQPMFRRLPQGGYILTVRLHEGNTVPIRYRPFVSIAGEAIRAKQPVTILTP